MSKHESDDLEGLGYWLPEDSQFRLARLSDHIRFLARLAQPRIADEEAEWAPDVRMGELTFCLEVLAEQLDLVLGEVSWPTRRTAMANAPAPGVTSATAPQVSDTEPGRFILGVTMDQIDELDRLIQMISAHGNAVAASDMADVAGHTLHMLGHAIFDGAAAVRDILDQVEAQRLGQTQAGVGEERGAYAAGLAHPAGDGPPGPVLPLSAYRSLEHASQPRRLRLHHGSGVVCRRQLGAAGAQRLAA